jgi:hypothetical protein
MEDGQRSNSVFTESDQSREGKSCGLDVEPEVAFRSGQKQKANMKKLQLAIVAASLAAAMSASAAITYSDGALAGLDYSAHIKPQDAQYVPASGLIPAYAALYTANAGTSGDSPAVFIQGPLGTLNALSASYTLLSSGPGPGNVQPYFILYLTDDPTYSSPILSTYGTPLNSFSSVHVGNLTHGSITLSALDAVIDPNSGLPYGQSTVAWVGLEIGNGGSGAANANIDSITVVPEPTTMIAGALLLLPFGASTVRILRKRQTA